MKLKTNTSSHRKRAEAAPEGCRVRGRPWVAIARPPIGGQGDITLYVAARSAIRRRGDGGVEGSKKHHFIGPLIPDLPEAAESLLGMKPREPALRRELRGQAEH